MRTIKRLTRFKREYEHEAKGRHGNAFDAMLTDTRPA